MANGYRDTDDEDLEGVLSGQNIEQNDVEATGDEVDDEDEVEDGVEEPNPGEEIINFGNKHAGKTFDEVMQVDQNYIDWAVEEYKKRYKQSPNNIPPFFRTMKDLYDRKKAWTEKNEQKILPGSIPMWFGKHAGVLFEDLEDGYVMSLINMWIKDGENAKPNIRKFKELYDRYNLWLVEEKIRTWKSPGSIPIWFGQDKGREFRKIYKDQPRKWRFLLKNTRWAPVLKAIALDYEEWLSTHRRTQTASRSAPVIVNPVGERLGPMDDGAASDYGSYDSDNGFVVHDELYSSDDGETQEAETDEESDYHSTNEDGENDTTGASPHSGVTESDEDFFPTLEEVLKGKSGPPSLSKRRIAGVSKDFPVSIESGDESDEVIPSEKIRTPNLRSGIEKRVGITLDSPKTPAVIPEENESANKGSDNQYITPPSTQDAKFGHDSRQFIDLSADSTKQQNSNTSDSESESESQLSSPCRRRLRIKTSKSKAQARNPDSSDSDVVLTLERRKSSKRARSVESTDSETILTRRQTRGKGRKRQAKGKGVKA